MYRYGVVGNCQVNALIDEFGSVEWFCMPRPDSPPLFGRLLDAKGGEFVISSAQGECGVQRYVTNTNILETTFTQQSGAQFKITDFCPRFEQYGRMYRPPMLIRMVTPIQGAPVIKVRCKPVNGWSKTPLQSIHGNSHVQFSGLDSGDGGENIRLTTNMPLTYLNLDQSFVLHEPLYFVFGCGPFENDLRHTCESFMALTEKYWNTWVKHCSIPSLFQEEVIRSALVLKLHCYEDTGAILASLTTSLPEEIGSVRNWDYRLCWMRDAYFALSAFHSLGQFEEMEGFVRFMLNIAQLANGERIHPVYRLDCTLPLPEISHENWAGFEGSQPVRSGNDAATHVQNDVYGEMILSIAPLFFDERFYHLRNPNHVKLLESLATQCIAALGVADAGVWEFRNTWRVHSFSTLLCWAGLERVERLVKMGHCKIELEKIQAAKAKAEELLKAATVDGSVRNSTDDTSFDASLALMAILRYSDRDVSKKTMDKIYENLTIKEDGKIPAFFYRYVKQDDFGRPKSAFLACSFWAANAFASSGNKELAQTIIERTSEARNNLGLYAEHFEPVNGVQLGNFPQAYSHVGLINTAFAVSPPWCEVL